MNALQSSIEVTDGKELMRYPRRSLKDLSSLHKKVVFSQVDSHEEAIEKRYTITTDTFFFKCSFEEKRKLITLTVKKIDVNSLLRTMAKAAVVGAVGGGIIGGVVSWSPAGVLPGMKAGAALGLVMGAGKVFLETSKVTIPESASFKNWKKGLSKEKYDLFLNLFKNYSKFLEPNVDGDIEVETCYLTGDIPTIPVRSPNSDLYDRETIEQKLKEKAPWDQICSQAGKGKAFTLGDLEYDIEYAKKMIIILKRVKKNWSTEPQVKAENDPFLEEILNTILNHYRENDKLIKKDLRMQLMRDLIAAGATDDQCKACMASYKSFYKQKKD